jgi:hypothetical protein
MEGRLVRITHYRCGDYSDTSYVWAAPGLPDHQLKALCDAARAACLEAEADAKSQAPPYPQEPNARLFPPETTAGEMLAHHQRQKDEHDAWKKKQSAARRTFEDWLGEFSGGKVVSLHAATEDQEEIDVSWGHAHGLSPRYGTERRWGDQD